MIAFLLPRWVSAFLIVSGIYLVAFALIAAFALATWEGEEDG